MDTKERILSTTKRHFARYGYGGVSVRSLVKDLGLAKSTLYHYYESKDDILHDIFEITRKELGVKRAKLEDVDDIKEKLEQRVKFQFENAEDIVFIFKYYLHFRNKFPKNDRGFLPKASYKHIEEVLQYGVDSGKLSNSIDIESNAQVITHAINGFVLEHFPAKISKEELNIMSEMISSFLVRAINA